jgi:hypothetical protein
MKQICPLPHALKIKNTQEIIRDLHNIPSLPQYTLASLDIKNLYPSIPKAETRTILTNILQHKLIEPHNKQDILNCYDAVTKQTFFSHNSNLIIQRDSLAKGAPSSGLIAEIFLQHIEHLHLPLLMQKHHLANYWRYIHDYFSIFDSKNTNIHDILNDFNTLHPKLQFTAEIAIDHTLNYLDITILKTATDFRTAIYRKPTFTDNIIPHTSDQPAHHKYAAVRFFFKRLNSYNLQ